MLCIFDFHFCPFPAKFGCLTHPPLQQLSLYKGCDSRRASNHSQLWLTEPQRVSDGIDEIDGQLVLLLGDQVQVY